MCYLVAKHLCFPGCVAYRSSHGPHLREFKMRIIRQIGYEEVELVVLSRPSAYPEYAPYRIMDTEEFISAVIELYLKTQIRGKKE